MVIRAYWLVWPQRRRRRCIYRETCSKYVFRMTENFGLRAGLKALWQRYRSCRPGYEICTAGGSIHVKLVDGTLLPATEASESTIGSILECCADYETRLNTGEPDKALQRTAECRTLSANLRLNLCPISQ